MLHAPLQCAVQNGFSGCHWESWWMVFLRKGSVYEKIIPTQKKTVLVHGVEYNQERHQKGALKTCTSKWSLTKTSTTLSTAAHTYSTHVLCRGVFSDAIRCSASLRVCITALLIAQPIQTSQEKTESLHRGIQALTALAKASQSGQWSSSATLGTLGVHSLPFIAQLASPWLRWLRAAVQCSFSNITWCKLMQMEYHWYTSPPSCKQAWT